ncbi:MULTISPECIES: transporter substrate-binding domain-containing protein [Pseudomonas]|jgi:polar amino acid transport system substrate-binding protein|uniref:Transporter substrate-binding domain-containing protein n=2 Tax=Pseudomonas TaxID=286 RepID=A0A4Y9TKL7_PSEFL|nr:MULTISPECIES: transporter substrate-binding domain-containing protein [Pseudomonas]MCX9152170.1 transporter substrate-binding domain-containing protein [Pseudomonas sp. TB1-B1]QXH67883.1 transporter substrate-binding domain-containing protein [Pseudomonas asgharzadehiana]TFW43920.1 transporter substrate-binding domain-containing protein [Pseudomonas fluorescens]TKJ61566.1 amino acid ABC transporter substrate-binding protein [Pseudomonas sp. CFBP13506]CRM49409.1 Glutamine-binding periplasmic
MIKRYCSALLLGAVALIHTGQALAGAIDDAVRRGVLKVGTTPTYVPFEMTDKQGRIVGFEIDLLKVMSQALGVELELVSVPYTELIKGLQAKHFDLIGSGMTVTQERNLALNFSDSFIVVGQTVLLRPGLLGKVASVEDLDDASYRIAATEGTTGESAAQRFLGAARVSSFATPEEGVRQVVIGAADAFVHDAPYNLIALSRPENSALLLLEQPFTFEPLAFGVKKGDFDSLNWINHFLNQVAQDGTYDRLHDKWFKDTAWLGEIDSKS